MKPEYQKLFLDPGFVDVLQKEIDWLHVQARRGESFQAYQPYEYQYITNGPVYKAVSFHPLVETWMKILNNQFGCNLNVCFLNYYKDQTQSLDWHADDNVGIDHDQPIAVISVGAEREIWWKPKGEKGVVPPEQRQLLGDGSLFVMPPHFQDGHYHKIPKWDRPVGARISMTYRSWKTT